MKRILALIALLLALCACARGVASNNEIAAQQTRMGAAKEVVAPGAGSSLRYGRGFLSPEEQAIYDRLQLACEQYDVAVRIPPPAGMDSGDFAVLAGYFSDDHPEFYWAEPVWLEEGDGAWIGLLLRGEWDVEELRRRDEEIEQAAQAMLDGVSAPPAECVYAVHDRLVERVNYDGGNLREDSENIYGALVKRYAICEGYARAFQYLMQRRGMDCVWLRGSSSWGAAHAWNAVRLDDEWYYVDVTWDTIDPWRRKTYHSYLGNTLEETLLSHRFDADQYPELPQADSHTYNYYYYNAYSVDPIPGDEVRQLAEAFANRLGDARIPQERDWVFLDIKVYADSEEYERVRELFIKELSAVLRALENLVQQRGLAVEIDTGGEVRCNFSDEQQILILLLQAEKH